MFARHITSTDHCDRNVQHVTSFLRILRCSHGNTIAGAASNQRVIRLFQVLATENPIGAKTQRAQATASDGLSEQQKNVPANIIICTNRNVCSTPARPLLFNSS
jgi:hypothetical protein